MQYIEVYKGYVELVENENELECWFDKLEDNSILTFDWETTGLNYDAIPLGLSLHQRGVSPCFAPVDYFFDKGIPMGTLARICNEHFKRLRLIAHNAKYDYMISIMNGISREVITLEADTLVMVHLYNPNLAKQLEKRVEEDFGYSKKTFDKICGKKWPKIDWAKEGNELLPLLAGYAGEDTYWETQVYHKYKNMLDEDAWKIMRKIELPLIPILADAKIRGVRIDVPLLQELHERCEGQLIKVRENIFDEAGCVFNLNSPKQKQQVFFERLKLPIIGRTRTGAPSTDSKAAVEWANMGYEIGKLLVKYSELQKLESGYLKPIPILVDAENVLRGDLNSCGTKTGRFSSSDPNLQNMPNNHDFPVRDAFIPRPGYLFVNYDYSQLELRVMAHMSKDPVFIDIFTHGRDPHGEVAKHLGITRKKAKVANFGVLYGLSDESFAAKFGVTTEQAHQIVEDYHKTYYGFAKWKVATENFAKKHGYVKNLFGRIRQLPMATKTRYDKGFRFGEFAKDMRRAVNTIIQGTGADIMKLATIATVKEIKRRGLDAHFLLQVHDENLIEARIDQAKEVEQIMIDCMENTTKLCVPLEADGKIIAKWGEMKDLALSYFDRFDYSLYSSLL